MMRTCIKQHLRNIWSLIHEKVKQHWVRVEKKQLLIKKQQTINFEKKVKLALLNYIIF